MFISKTVEGQQNYKYSYDGYIKLFVCKKPIPARIFSFLHFLPTKFNDFFPNTIILQESQQNLQQLNFNLILQIFACWKTNNDNQIWSAFKMFKYKYLGFYNKNLGNFTSLNKKVKSMDTKNYIKTVSRDSGIRSHFSKVQSLYEKQINLAIYMDLTDIQKLKVFEIVDSHQSQNFVVNFYGFRMSLSDALIQKLFKLYIREMDLLLRNQTKRKYSILLFHSPSENKNSFDVLKDMYKKLPALYFGRLNKIYVIQPGFLTKSLGFINFTAWSKLWHKYVEYIQQVQDIQQMEELKIYNILCKCPKEITKDIKLQCQIPNIMRSAIKMTPKASPFDCLKRELNTYKIDKARGVPLLLAILVETMKQNKQCCLKEGIFRSAGSIEDEEEILKYAIGLQTFKTLDSSQYCKRAISGVIKKIFTESSTPLIPYNIYNEILNDKIDEQFIVQYWKKILEELPSLNRKILCYITQFLRDSILANKEQNKMNAHNLSVVFTPCFFRSRVSSLEDLINSGKYAALYKNFIEKYEEIVGNRKSSTTDEQKEECMLLSRCRKNVEKIHFNSKVLRQQSPQPV